MKKSKNEILKIWDENYNSCNFIRLSCSNLNDYKSSFKLTAISETGYRDEVEEVDILDEVFINYFATEVHKIIESYVEEENEELTYVLNIEGEIIKESDAFEIWLSIDTPDGEDELQEFV
jgi:hypothetical protein